MVLIQASQVCVQITNPVPIAMSVLVILRESSLEFSFGTEAERQKIRVRNHTVKKLSTFLCSLDAASVYS